MSELKVKEKPEILLIEDDHVFRRIVAKSLERNNFVVREAENGLVGQTIFNLNPDQFDLIISDIRMPEMDGVTLLQNIRKTSQTPFIVMTGFSEILESKTAHEYGANAFLPKPLRTKALLEEIHHCLYPDSKGPQKPPRINEFRQIHIDEFMSTTNLHSDIYLALGTDHYVKVAHKGDAISIDRLKVYRANKVTHLYITEEDFRAYANFNVNLANSALKSAKVPMEKKVLVLKHAAEVLTEICLMDQLDKEMVKSANAMVTNAIQLVSEEVDALQLLTSLSASKNPLYTHSVSVSMFASLIAQRYGWNSAPSQYKIALSGLFHDAGKRELPPALLTKKRALQTPEEVMQIETHPVRAWETLLQIPGIPEEVAQVAFEHHEKMNGTGYPRRLRGEAIHPLARLIHIADRFVNYVMPLTDGATKLTPEEAVMKLATLHIEEVDSHFLLCLSQLFNMEGKVQPLIKKAAAAA